MHHHLINSHVFADSASMGAAEKKMKVRTAEKIRVLVCDEDGQTSRRMVEFLTLSGFECRSVAKGADARKVILAWTPRVILVDMLFPEMNAFSTLYFLQTDPQLRQKEISTIVISSHNTEENVKEAYRRGAADYMARPIMYQDLLARIVFHCREKKALEEREKNRSKDSLKIADLILSQTLQNAPFEKILFNLTKMATLRMKGLRCSVIRQITLKTGWS